MSNLFRTLTAFAAAISLIGCKATAPPPDYYHVQGVVRDQGIPANPSGAWPPIAGAVVEIVDFCGGIGTPALSRTTTGPDGRFMLVSPKPAGHCQVGSGGALIISKDGFRSMGGGLLLDVPSLQTWEVSMRPAIVSFSVTASSSSVPLGGRVSLEPYARYANGYVGHGITSWTLVTDGNIAFGPTPCGTLDGTVDASTRTFVAPATMPATNCGGSALNQVVVRASQDTATVNITLTLVP